MSGETEEVVGGERDGEAEEGGREMGLLAKVPACLSKGRGRGEGGREEKGRR